MLSALKALLSTATTLVRPRAKLLLEVAALRQQLRVYRRQNRRPKLDRGDRMFWIWLKRAWPGWRSALVLVQPETVLRWHREGYRAAGLFPRATPDS
ncbi:MAG: putative transposase [Myxococcota bacterium]|jgi:putative transposase